MVADLASLKILAIHAHPDDIEIQCAGTLLKLRQLGCCVAVATMTSGDKGSDELSADQISEVRRAEAIASAAMMDVEYTCLEIRDLSIVFDNESRRRMAEFLRRQQPDIILAPPPVDYMHDHEITSQLVRDACFNAAVPNYRTEQWDPAPRCTGIPHLYYVDAVEGTDHFGVRHPIDMIVDISDVIEQRLELLACHASQREWLRRQHGIDEYIIASRRWAAKRGSEIEVEYGEGFRQYKGHPYPTGNLLGQLLSESRTSNSGERT